MSALLLALLGFGAAFLLDELFSGSNRDETPDQPPEQPDPDADTVNLVTNGFTSLGGAGDDTYLTAPDETLLENVDIDAGAGDDIINLGSEETGSAAFASSFAGGDGNDRIVLVGGENTVSGGDGNDTIIVDGLADDIDAGTGDDFVRYEGGAADRSLVIGGDGDDTGNISGSENVIANGGAGDDLLISSGSTIDGTGYVLGSDGGAGDDTLRHTTEVFPLPLQEPSQGPALLIGGAGEDLFVVELEAVTGGRGSGDTEAILLRNDAVTMPDFDKDQDALQIDIPGSLSGYEASNATLTEDTSSGRTIISITLTDGTAENLPDQEVLITIGATGLTWDDVTFTDLSPATLLTASA